MEQFLAKWQDVHAPDQLRARIMAGIAPRVQLVMRQLRFAQSFAMMLLLASFSVYVSTVSVDSPVGLLDIQPSNYSDSVVMESYQLSKDVVLESIIISD